MRYIGKCSVSSFLGFVCNLAWYINIMIGCVLIIGLIVFTIYGPDLMPSSLQDFSFKTPGLEIYIDQEMVTLKPLTRSAVIAAFGSTMPLVIIASIILYQLKKIFATFAHEKLFEKENVLRVRKIGVTVMVGAVLQSLMDLFIGRFIMTHISIPGIILVPRIRLNLHVLFSGLAVLVLAEVLKQGTELKEDQDLTV